MEIDSSEKRFGEDDNPDKEPVVMASLIVTNKLYEHVIEDAAERLAVILRVSKMGLELDEDEVSSYRFLFRAIKRIAKYPLSTTENYFKDTDTDE